MTTASQREDDHFSFPAYQAPARFTDLTRYLCGAAYFDGSFADTVIREVVEDERRAVALSFGFDLNPVVRHCFRARRLSLIREAVLFGLVLVGLVVSPPATLAWLLVGATVLAWRTPEFRRLSLAVRVGIVAVLGAVVLCCLGGALAPVLNAVGAALRPAESGYSDAGTGRDVLGSLPNSSDAALVSFLWAMTVAPVVLAVATLSVLVLFRHRGYRIVTEELARGAEPSLPPLPNPRVARRVAAVSRAQYGDITVQEKEAFLGCGKPEHGWSYAIPLRRVRRPGDPAGATGTDPALDQESMGPDLTGYVRAAVRRMREDPLPKGVRVPGLSLVPHIVADGVRRQGDPLLDPETGIPRSKASAAVVEAVIRHPQGGLRYYDRIVISGAGKPIHTPDGREVLPEQSLGIDISAFFHVAVEGGMLYVEFVSAVLPPVRPRYALADLVRPRTVTRRALREALPELFTASLLSGWRLARGLWRAGTMSWRMNEAAEASTEFRSHNYGARVSVRELVAEPVSVKHLQLLDEWKYTKLLERAVLEAVAAFLTERGLEAADLVRRAEQVQNIFGNVTTVFGGQQAFGSSNVSFHQQNT
ncbi:hypothetical protein ACFY3U_21615 [Micromonospora sp. NPDC000089]|uniref:hypothetical protein n=1 Tax=unclassified Micromonospora TaxID=2617518 RepID=UPI003696A36B